MYVGTEELLRLRDDIVSGVIIEAIVPALVHVMHVYSNNSLSNCYIVSHPRFISRNCQGVRVCC